MAIRADGFPFRRGLDRFPGSRPTIGEQFGLARQRRLPCILSMRLRSAWLASLRPLAGFAYSELHMTDSNTLGLNANGPSSASSTSSASSAPAATVDVRASRPKRTRLYLSVLATLALLALLVLWIGPATIRTYHDELLFDLGAHLSLVGWSMLAAILTGVPAGIVLSRPAFIRYAERLMQIFNVGNTIPSLAVLVLSLAVLGIGSGPAILALWLASVLPITRNTYEGLRQVPAAMREAATGLGMTRRQSLLRVELPNALPMVMGGVRTALAINVGTAPLSFLIGADSLGTLIFPGIYLNNQPQLLLGAVATALLALVLDMAVAGIAKLTVTRGSTTQ